MSEIIGRLNAALTGRYVVEREIGEGGMATVYLAADLRHERKVALKVLRPELAAVMGADRFLSEIKTTANLQHPHILPLFDSGAADGFLFYVMPYVEGESLRDRIRREVQLGVDEAVRLARSVAGALHAAHEAGIIHRDIKPENILLSRGEPLVSDFGIALAVSQAGGGRLTETGLSLGTPYYMSPEQAAADRDPGRASDVYSLGCVLYEMLVGDPPHTGSSAQAVLAKILTEEPRDVTTVRKTVPPHVADAVARALERLPADRFESADAFARALSDPGFRHRTTVAGTAAAAPTPSAGADEPPRHPAAVVAPWAFAALATLAAVAGWMRSAGVENGPMELTLDPGVDSLGNGAFLAVSPDGRRFALAGRESEGDVPIYVRTADNGEWRALPGTEGAWGVTFSPDGQRIAYVADGERNVLSVSFTGGSPLTLYTSQNDVYELHWGPTGDIVASADDGIRRIRSGGGVDTLLLDEGSIFFPFLLPNGSAVLYGTVQGGARAIRVLEFDGSPSRVVIDEGNRPIYLPGGYILFAHPDGGLQVVPFDLDRRQVTGSPVPVLDGVVDRGFAVSDAGTLVYRTGIQASFAGGNTRFLIVGLDGTVDTLRLPERNQSQIRVSPDGAHMAFTVRSDQGDGAQIFTYDLARRTGPTQLTFEGRNAVPVWSPDGTRVAYRHDQTSIHAKAVDGGAPAIPLLEDTVDVWPTAWTGADDLVFERRGSGEVDLLRKPSEGSSRVVELLRTDFREYSAAVSPDERWFTYISNEVGSQPQAFVRAYPSALGPWNVSRGPAFGPKWSVDGSSIFFIRPGSETAIERVDVALEPSFVAGAPVSVWTGRVRDFEVHPDGRHLVVAENVTASGTDDGQEGGASRIVVVLNWLDHVRTLVRTGRER